MIQFIRGLYNKIRLFFALSSTKTEKELDSILRIDYNSFTTSVSEEEAETQRKYYNGLTLLKRRVRSMAVDGNLGQAMSGLDDLIPLAASEEADDMRAAMKSVVVAKGQDIKTEEDKTRMIDTRINHYTTLHAQKLKRELSAKIRKAKYENKAEHERLMKEWNKLYGN